MQSLSNYKKRAAICAAMMDRNNKKNKKTIETLTISLDSLTGTNDNKETSQKNTDSLHTDNRTKTREIRSLCRHARDWKQYHTSKYNENRIIHWDSLKNMMMSNTVCRCCGSDVSLMERTTGISTQIILTCKNSSCNMNETNQVKKKLIM